MMLDKILKRAKWDIMGKTWKIAIVTRDEWEAVGKLEDKRISSDGIDFIALRQPPRNVSRRKIAKSEDEYLIDFFPFPIHERVGKKEFDLFVKDISTIKETNWVEPVEHQYWRDGQIIAYCYKDNPDRYEIVRPWWWRL